MNVCMRACTVLRQFSSPTNLWLWAQEAGPFAIFWAGPHVRLPPTRKRKLEPFHPVIAPPPEHSRKRVSNTHTSSIFMFYRTVFSHWLLKMSDSWGRKFNTDLEKNICTRSLTKHVFNLTGGARGGSKPLTSAPEDGWDSPTTPFCTSVLHVRVCSMCVCM